MGQVESDMGGLLQGSEEKKLEYEFTRNPGHEAKSGTSAESDTQFNWEPRLKVFLMDTRTKRHSMGDGVPHPMYSEEQGRRVENWLSMCGDEPSVFLLGVPVPISFSHENRISHEVERGRPELADDSGDGWWILSHAEQREQILGMIRDHAAKCPNDRIVVASGDAHESGLYAILDPTNRIAAYEIVSSGVSTLTDKGLHGISVTGTYLRDVMQIGRIAQGASFAELFMEFPKQEKAPVVSVLFYATTGADEHQNLENRLVNVFQPDTEWALMGSTPTNSLWEGGRIGFPDKDRFVLRLEYAVNAGKSTNYGLSSRAVRCETNIDASSHATDWSQLGRDSDISEECKNNGRK